MATFHLELDKRVKLKNDRFNLSVRVGRGNDNMYLKFVPLTVEQYEKVFRKKTMDIKSVELRKECNEFLSRCETLFADLKPFDKGKYRQLVYGKKDTEKELGDSLLLKNLITRYLNSNPNIKLHTRDMYQTALNSFEEYKPGITIQDITPAFLMAFEKSKNSDDYSPSTISCYMRHLRSIINHFSDVDRIIPIDYKYPFGKRGGYIIRNCRSQKIVMENSEIEKVANFNKFQNKEQEYARDIWLMLYRCNGMNYTDLIQLKWTDIKGDLILFTRAKTENTRRNNVRDIVVPVIPSLIKLIEKVGVKSSPFILGILEKGYNEGNLQGKKGWQLEKIRESLKYISSELKLSVDLRLKTARDCYATTLKRAGHPIDVIGEMMGHAPVQVTDHYLGIIDKKRLFKINRCLY
jgi:integrase